MYETKLAEMTFGPGPIVQLITRPMLMSETKHNEAKLDYFV